jgi:hypothetical protein
MRVIAILAVLLALPASATAATVSVDGGVLRVTGRWARAMTST